MMLKKLAGAASFAAFLALTATASQAEELRYVQNSAGEAVKNSFGECVRAMYGSTPEGCGTAPAPKPEPAKPAAKPAPAPKPVIKPAPKPKPIVPKPKVKGNYRGPVAIDPASRSALQQYQR